MGRMFAPLTTKGRQPVQTVKTEIIFQRYGNTQTYNGVDVGGSFVRAVLGPDLGDGQRRGSMTASGKSLAGVIPNLRATSAARGWIAGHLLNGAWGGSGTESKNLTPLTSQANSNHETFENHVNQLLGVCNAIDRNAGSARLTYWYAVQYKVDVSASTFAQSPSPGDWHSYAFSHITVEYRVVQVDKQTRVVSHTMPADGYSGWFSRIQAPQHQGPPAITIVAAGLWPYSFGPVEIHNL